MAKRYSSRPSDLFDRISDGNLSLARAVEYFDFARGVKFSTYATWALIRNFASSIHRELRYQYRFLAGHDEMIDTIEDERKEQGVEEESRSQQHREVTELLEYLDQREQQVLRCHFGLKPAEERMTLQEIGEQMGISKERARQIERRALAKLREIAQEVSTDFGELSTDA